MKRIVFRNFAGTKMDGTVPMHPDSNKDGEVSHPERAAWLTAQVESNGKYGCVMNYDGTGVTAGLHQAVAVFPRDLGDKGTLWELLADVGMASGIDYEFINLQEFFVDNGFEFCMDGALRYRDTGRRAKGDDIRWLLTGDFNGIMPIKKNEGRERAERAVFLFHHLFRAQPTFHIQNLFGMKHFAKWSHRTLRFSKKFMAQTIDDFVYRRISGKNFMTIKNGDLPPELDLAMCMFWSHTVNAPGQALRMLCKVVELPGCSPLMDPEGVVFAAALIEYFGTSKYGRWDDDIKNGRYQRTRNAAMRLKGIWGDELFDSSDSIMPKDFED